MQQITKENIAFRQTPFVISGLNALENGRIRSHASIEQRWWQNYLVDSLCSPPLYRVPNESAAYRLIGKLQREEEPPYARTGIREILDRIGVAWKTSANSHHIDTEGVQLSVTSLWRPAQLQSDLQLQGQPTAIGFSAHQAGVAVDIDPRGYYRFGKPVNPSVSEYNPGVTKTLDLTISEMADQGLFHLIKEYRYKTIGGGIRRRLSCFHICLIPCNSE